MGSTTPVAKQMAEIDGEAPTDDRLRAHLDPGDLVLLRIDDARRVVAQLRGALGDEPHGLVLAFAWA